MWEGRRVLVVVPARGGSRGIPLKNLRPVGGVPLVARVGRLVSGLPWVDRAVVSTDHAEIAKTARESGLEVPFFRPEALSGDRVGDLEVLTHALLTCEDAWGERFDVLVMLQPTSPLRRAEHVTATVEALVAGGHDSVWTVSPSDSKTHPLKQLTFEDGHLALWDAAGSAVVARQQLSPVYHRNGAAYAFTRACLLDQKTILGERASAVVIDEQQLSIDTPDDLAKAEWLLAARRSDPVSANAPVPATPGPRTFVVDVDGVVASLVPENDYRRSQPLRANIARINALHAAGHRIVLFTARGSATGKDWTELTARQLEDWGVLHHELRFGKPAADYYIDDRHVSLTDAVEIAGASEGPDGEGATG